MSMGKKLNVQELLDSAILDNIDTGEKTRELKEQRNTKLLDETTGANPEIMESTGHGLTKGNQKTGVSRHSEALDKLSDQQRKRVEEFLGLMETENYVDKKEQFILRLSKDCFSDYEKLTSVYNYKMGEKATRNDIMRKVLEHFHSQYIPALIKNLERI